MKTIRHALELTHLEKVYWPDDSITKGDMLDYYLKVSKIILPYLKDRPMVLNRHPEGINGESFFQKQARSEKPNWIQTTSVWIESN